ncbi:protein kinase [Actinosynnema sp. NPDC020468]|uniref:protein kinase domain-containing protein n=1 Tax=Actinosynnema sp. NPDC020468 TaxID=3154488 RepID=UPI0033D808C2
MSDARWWFQEEVSPYPWEQDALDHVRRSVTGSWPHRAWATFTFTAPTGRVNECDLLFAAPAGLFLVEIKSHPGSVRAHGENWRFNDGGTRRALRNPLHLVDRKAKELRSVLDSVARVRVPRIEPAVFLSAPGLSADMNVVQRQRVYGRDGAVSGLPWLWRDLLGAPPDGPPVDADFVRDVLPGLLDEVGIRVATAHLRFGDEWELDPKPLDAGADWEDRLARRIGDFAEEGRLRVHLSAVQGTEASRRSVERAAEREYRLLQHVVHRGIAQPLRFGPHPGGWAILFRHRASDLRLDDYLDVHEPTSSRRLDLVRQVAEAVHFAHGHALGHRALGVRSVWVSVGARPEARIADWQTAFRTGDPAASIGQSAAAHFADPEAPWLAPESRLPDAGPVAMDVFGLGVLAYHVLTGEPPARHRADLLARLAAEDGLRPRGVHEALGDLVFAATRTRPGRRPSVEEFLRRLDAVEREHHSAGGLAAVDPLDAQPGTRLGRWLVERVLGTGSTARVLQVVRVAEDGSTERRVLKVALDEDRAERLHAEARALTLVGGGGVVRLLDGPLRVHGRTAVELEYAADRSLGGHLRAAGGLTRPELTRWGADVFAALEQVAAMGVRHRDVKPDNFGLCRRDGARRLVLYDFSLSEALLSDTTSGTWGYLDPFVGTAARPLYDDHAERYAAAVTLHEMASGVRPVWGDGTTHPAAGDAVTATPAEHRFDPDLRPALTAFFRRALHRDVAKRFPDLRSMRAAWTAAIPPPRRTGRSRRPPLRAGYALLVVLLVAGSFAVARTWSHDEAAQFPTSRSSPPPTPPPGQRIALELGIAVDPVPHDVRLGESVVATDRQTLVVHNSFDDRKIATITRYAPDMLDLRAFDRAEQISLGGRSGYFVGDLPLGDRSGDRKVIALRDAGGWFTVESETNTASDRALVRSLAERVRLDRPAPLRFPVRIRSMPYNLRPCGATDGLRAVGTQWHAYLHLCDATPTPSWSGDSEIIALDLTAAGEPHFEPYDSSGRSRGTTVDCGDFQVVVVIRDFLRGEFPKNAAAEIAGSLETRPLADPSRWFSGSEVLPAG